MFVQNLQENVKYSYDYDHDVLYIYLGEQKCRTMTKQLLVCLSGFLKRMRSLLAL